MRGEKDHHHFSLRGRMVQLVNKEFKVQKQPGQESLTELSPGSRDVWLKLSHGHHCT